MLRSIVLIDHSNMALYSKFILLPVIRSHEMFSYYESLDCVFSTKLRDEERARVTVLSTSALLASLAARTRLVYLFCVLPHGFSRKRESARSRTVATDVFSTSISFFRHRNLSVSFQNIFLCTIAVTSDTEVTDYN